MLLPYFFFSHDRTAAANGEFSHTPAHTVHPYAVLDAERSGRGGGAACAAHDADGNPDMAGDTDMDSNPDMDSHTDSDSDTEVDGGTDADGDTDMNGDTDSDGDTDAAGPAPAETGRGANRLFLHRLMPMHPDFGKGVHRHKPRRGGQLIRRNPCQQRLRKPDIPPPLRPQRRPDAGGSSA